MGLPIPCHANPRVDVPVSSPRSPSPDITQMEPGDAVAIQRVSAPSNCAEGARRFYKYSTRCFYANDKFMVIRDVFLVAEPIGLPAGHLLQCIHQLRPRSGTGCQPAYHKSVC